MRYFKNLPTHLDPRAIYSPGSLAMMAEGDWETKCRILLGRVALDFGEPDGHIKYKGLLVQGWLGSRWTEVFKRWADNNT